MRGALHHPPTGALRGMLVVAVAQHQLKPITIEPMLRNSALQNRRQRSRAGAPEGHELLGSMRDSSIPTLLLKLQRIPERVRQVCDRMRPSDRDPRSPC